MRTRIVDAADALYYARGFHAVGMDQVRDAAGVSLRRLYQLFPSKDDLVLAVLAKRHDLWTDGVAARVATVDGAEARLLAIYDYLADWFIEDTFRGCGFINAFGELGAADPRVAEAARTLADCIPRDLLPQARIDGDSNFMRAFYADFAPAQAEALRRALRILTEEPS